MTRLQIVRECVNNHDSYIHTSHKLCFKLQTLFFPLKSLNGYGKTGGQAQTNAKFKDTTPQCDPHRLGTLRPPSLSLSLMSAQTHWSEGENR